MSEIHELEKDERKTCPPRGGQRGGSAGQPHPVELRLRAVKLRLEEGFPLDLVAREAKVSQSTLSNWIRRYRQHGEAGLKPPSPLTVMRGSPGWETGRFVSRSTRGTNRPGNSWRNAGKVACARDVCRALSI